MRWDTETLVVVAVGMFIIGFCVCALLTVAGVLQFKVSG